MDFEFLAYLSWREVLVAIVVLLVLYILFAFLRINRLRNESRRAQDPSPLASQTAVAAYAAVQEPAATSVTDAAQGTAAEPSLPEPEEPLARNETLPERWELRRIEALEQDVAQLRREIGGLRAEVHAMREVQRREINKVQVAQNASPFYSDAMQLAVQGREAADISVLCGISRAEAELVVALARNQDQPLD